MKLYKHLEHTKTILEQEDEQYFLTPPEADAESVIAGWEEDDAKTLAQELIAKLGVPDFVEKDQLVWNNVNDYVEGTRWDQVIVRDMADPHLDHTDSLFATKHIDFSEDKREAIHKVEGVIATPGTHVVQCVVDFLGSTIF